MECVYDTVILSYLNTLNRNVGVSMLHLRSTVDVRSLMPEVDTRYISIVTHNHACVSYCYLNTLNRNVGVSVLHLHPSKEYLAGFARGSLLGRSHLRAGQ